MAITLREKPIIKITTYGGELLDEAYPGYELENFNLTKRLLEPNKLEFTLRRNGLRIELDDYDFDMREDILCAKVEMSIKGRRYDSDKEEWVDYDVENFFYGYVQNVKVVRESISAPYRLKCTAFSPDSRLKGHPASNVFYGCDLKDVIEDVFGLNATEDAEGYSRVSGQYSNTAEGLDSEIEPVHWGDGEPMPYTVQYNESAYNFVKRMARRYGEYFYYEDHKVRFGELQDPEGLDHFFAMNLGYDLESYTYDLNMNDHSGVVFTEHHPNINKNFGYGFEKYEEGNNTDAPYYRVIDEDECENAMANSAFSMAEHYYGNFLNSVVDLASTPHIDDESESQDWNHTSSLNPQDITRHSCVNDDEIMNNTFAGEQRYRLDQYVMSDSLICSGKSLRGDLKLGSHIIICEMTRTDKGKEEEDGIEHKMLSVYDLTYSWPSCDEKNNPIPLSMDNTFKALPHDATVPPYLERDKDGILVYGDFDEYPKCGPQYGVVVDNEDPEHQGRVQVCLLWQEMIGRCAEGADYSPLDDDRNRTPWIWVVNPYQGYNHGSMLIPEIGDQVLVGFERNNAERPYVMGSRFNQKDSLTPVNDWKKNNKHNNIKGFRTLRGHTIEFIDGDPGETGRIRIYDRYNQNYDVVLDSDNRIVRLETPGNIELVAGGNIVMKANGNIQMNAEKDMVAIAKNDMKLNAHHELDCASLKELKVFSVEDDVMISAKKDLDLYAVDEKSVVFLRDKQAAIGFGKEDSATCSVDGCATKSSLVLDDKGVNLGADKAGSTVTIKSKKGDIEINAQTGIKIEAQTLKSNTKGETAMKGTPGHYD